MNSPDHASPPPSQEIGPPSTPAPAKAKHAFLRRWLRRIALLCAIIVLTIATLMTWNLRPPAVVAPTNFPSLSAPSSPSAPIRLRVMTWNVWGLRWITPRREERLAAVAREAAALNPDIVGFQEAFVSADRQKIIAALRETGLEHARYFPSGLVGSGLLLVSRFPIESDGFIRYQKGGKPEALQQGDWWAGKGLSLSIIRLPNAAPLYVANTHLHARYWNEPAALATQRAQSAQLLPWVKRVHKTGIPALWMGDWNSPPDTDVIAPLVQAGSWQLFTRRHRKIDNIFGSGAGWEWTVLKQGQITGHLEGEPRAPWSDHAARWIDVELRLQLP